ncbi:thiazole synthase [Saccharibacter sp. 17.LH.SD]|uniref:thiazole synthase n=1 Tax=Saccharibacter sp. 17.LH.SD TaxID=2689393 RepID=UPI00136EAFED|nr:thiazole synthase [Saccharibacter sp. 17.LH.SD]MXV44462.1 thiazole synthase [Saccharibacter sp. 17.LH.SD]
MAALTLYGQEVRSRLLLGTARYPSPACLQEAVEKAHVDIVTVSLRRETIGMQRGEGLSGQGFWRLIKQLGVHVLPNTAGCHSVREAVTTAQMAREILGTDWIKLEVIGDDQTLHPDIFGLVEAAEILVKEGFKVFPYTTTDLGVAERLLRAGCQLLMPWAAPIGSGQGISHRSALRTMRQSFADIPLIIDAGIGRPSHAVDVMEMGFDAVLLNTAVAQAGDPVRMAHAFAQAIEAGRTAYEADPMESFSSAISASPLMGRGKLG